MPEMQYNIVSTGPTGDTGMPTEPGYIGGGMLQRQDPVHAPVITLAVDDIDATLKAVEANGGSTSRPRSPSATWASPPTSSDSEGNLMGLWQNAG